MIIVIGYCVGVVFAVVVLCVLTYDGSLVPYEFKSSSSDGGIRNTRVCRHTWNNVCSISWLLFLFLSWALFLLLLWLLLLFLNQVLNNNVINRGLEMRYKRSQVNTAEIFIPAAAEWVYRISAMFDVGTVKDTP